jgi:hypothetical protein
MTRDETPTLAAITRDVKSGESSIESAISKAYSMGYAAGKADRHEMEADRIVRVGEGFKPEVQTDAN